ARPSTTSRHTSSAPRGDVSRLAKLIESLPRKRAEQVYTHASWAADRAASYERLEFLGDSVLELAIARELYERYPDFSEGRLAKIRSHVVSRASCAVVARQLNLGQQLAERGAAIIDGEQLGVGAGESKKAAEQEAAKEALAALGVEVSAA